jgi:Ca2+-binding EF-hand superfamily protein
VFLSNEARKLCHDPKATSELVEAVSEEPLSNFGNILDLNIDIAKEYLRKFAKMDMNKDGHLTYEEFKRGFEIQSDDVASGLFTLMDTNESGTINFKEFLVGVAVLNGRKMKKGDDDGTGFENAVGFAFEVFDSDRSGMISLRKLTNLMRKAFPGLTSQQIAKQQIGIKTNDKGQVTKSEFIRFCIRLHKHKDAFRDAHFGSIYIAPPPSSSSKNNKKNVSK